MRSLSESRKPVPSWHLFLYGAGREKRFPGRTGAGNPGTGICSPQWRGLQDLCDRQSPYHESGSTKCAVKAHWGAAAVCLFYFVMWKPISNVGNDFVPGNGDLIGNPYGRTMYRNVTEAVPGKGTESFTGGSGRGRREYWTGIGPAGYGQAFQGGGRR